MLNPTVSVYRADYAVVGFGFQGLELNVARLDDGTLAWWSTGDGKFSYRMLVGNA